MCSVFVNENPPSPATAQQLRVLIHAYSGGPKHVPKYTELGAYLSFPGGITNERSEDQRQALLVCPRERMLVETDSPDMLPNTQVLAEKSETYRELAAAAAAAPAPAHGRSRTSVSFPRCGSAHACAWPPPRPHFLAENVSVLIMRSMAEGTTLLTYMTRPFQRRGREHGGCVSAFGGQ